MSYQALGHLRLNATPMDEYCPGVETYLGTEKKHSFTHSFFPATQLSPLRVGCLVGCHVGCCVVVLPPPSAPCCRRHRRHSHWSSSRMTPATQTPAVLPSPTLVSHFFDTKHTHSHVAGLKGEVFLLSADSRSVRICMY